MQHAPKVQRRSNKALIAGLIVAAALVITGIVAFINRSSIEIRLASLRAGFSAQLPPYNITGYKVANIQSDKGKVAINYISGNSSYKITQELSSWDSQTLLYNFVLDISSKYKTIWRDGRTIYLYNKNQATWVNAGIRYTITGNAELSESELVSLATSL
jgi:hypothetical protein